MNVKYLSYAYTASRVALCLTLLSMLAAGCAPQEPTLLEEDKIALSLSSPVFREGEEIPVKYTCNGQDISPPIVWGEPPSGTQAFSLIMDDLDAPGGVFTHWVLFNLPVDSRELPEAVPRENQLVNQALQGTSDFGRIGYGGPCPPTGLAHHYCLTLYALDQPLSLKAGASKEQVLGAMQGHILAQGQLTGLYQR
jgi:Raf kinase inhibitor-like YbhB/YbcL family protein